jgi:hypothetical protein
MAADPSCSLLAVGAQRYVHLLDARAGAVVHRVSWLGQALRWTCCWQRPRVGSAGSTGCAAACTALLCSQAALAAGVGRTVHLIIIVYHR